MMTLSSVDWRDIRTSGFIKTIIQNVCSHITQNVRLLFVSNDIYYCPLVVMAVVRVKSCHSYLQLSVVICSYLNHSHSQHQAAAPTPKLSLLPCMLVICRAPILWTILATGPPRARAISHPTSHQLPATSYRQCLNTFSRKIVKWWMWHRRPNCANVPTLIERAANASESGKQTTAAATLPWQRYAIEAN